MHVKVDTLAQMTQSDRPDSQLCGYAFRNAVYVRIYSQSCKCMYFLDLDLGKVYVSP